MKCNRVDRSGLTKEIAEFLALRTGLGKKHEMSPINVVLSKTTTMGSR